MKLLNITLTKINILKIVWSVLSVCLLYSGIKCSINTNPHLNDCAVAFGWFIILLNGGSPLTLMYLLEEIRLLFNIDMFEIIPTDYTLSVVILWVIYTILGYIQWFILIPWLWHKLCKLLSRFKKSKND